MASTLKAAIVKKGGLEEVEEEVDIILLFAFDCRYSPEKSFGQRNYSTSKLYGFKFILLRTRGIV
jgi:hypothetical protein